MNNEIIKTGNIKLNSDGNQVISEVQDGGGKTQIIKYGLIRLMNEKTERRVSLKTIVDIEKAQKTNFTGKITITELNMSIYISQIVMMRSETEKIRIDGNIKNLPTANVCLNLDLKPTNKIRPQFIRDLESYYEATVHYASKDGQKEYYLEFDKIKRLLKIDFDADGYDYISKVYEYGIEK